MSVLSRNSASAPIDNRRLLWAAPAAGLVAAIIDLVILWIAQAALGTTIMVTMGPDGPAQAAMGGVLFAVMVPAILAGILLTLLKRFTAQPWRNFVIIAAAFALLSLGGPLTLSNPLGERLVLALLHLVTAVIIVLGIDRLARG